MKLHISGTDGLYLLSSHKTEDIDNSILSMRHVKSVIVRIFVAISPQMMTINQFQGICSQGALLLPASL